MANQAVDLSFVPLAMIERVEILREVTRVKRDLKGRDVVLRVSPAIQRALEGENRSVMHGIREIVQAPVNVLGDQTLHQEQFEVSS